MPLPNAALLALFHSCAPRVAPVTLAAVVQTESGGDALAIAVNGPKPYRLRPRSLDDAVSLATPLVAAGANVDLGLAQINGRNLGKLGLSVRAAFDPCRNLQAAAQVLAANYRRARPDLTGAQPALRVALSYYNTGRPDRGFSNGYVAKVTAAAAHRPATPMTAPERGGSPPPDWDVFGASSTTSAFVIAPSASGEFR